MITRRYSSVARYSLVMRRLNALFEAENTGSSVPPPELEERSGSSRTPVQALVKRPLAASTTHATRRLAIHENFPASLLTSGFPEQIVTLLQWARRSTSVRKSVSGAS
jgi:hypothetical protein